MSWLAVLPGNNLILSGSADSNVHVWSLPQLVSFTPSQSQSSNDPAPNAPLRTFSNHRSGITALACGHSRSLSNFAVSASSDGTCYIWSIGDCQVLRTILFPSAPQCFAVDPVDRAVYAGSEDGSIQCLDFYNGLQKSQHIQSSASSHAQQLHIKDSWSPASADFGSVECLTLSYDGTILLSGHVSGKILSWDIAKHRVQKMIADLGHPVTNISTQRPEGLPTKRPHIEVKTVVKPKLDQSSSTQTSTSGIPTDYSLQIQITSAKHSGLLTPPHELDFHNTISHPTFPKSLIDEAVLDLSFPATSAQTQQATAYDMPFPDNNDPPSTTQASQISKLESRIVLLEENLAIYVSATERSRIRRLARMERREKFARRKREAYFEARKKGEDGDVAMRQWEEKEGDVDAESDEVELGEDVYADV